jgi:hypothetical protein
MLTRVTITGADDKVDPQALLALSREFPFVEWGILFSVKRVGTPRYPSNGWIGELQGLADGNGVNLSAHLCGADARRLRDSDSWVPLRAFQRYQINGYESPVPRIVRLAAGPRVEFILQARDMGSLALVGQDARSIGYRSASVLFDPSGGRGIESSQWPVPPYLVRMGYAGGIKPENVVDVIRDNIGQVDSPFWIDMESGVRDANDQFDLARVRAVLEKTAPFVVPDSSP